MSKQLSYSEKSNNIWHYLAALIGITCISIFLGQVAINNLFTIHKSSHYLLGQYKFSYKGFLLFSQAIMATAIFILTPLFYWYTIEKKSIHEFFIGEQSYGKFILLTIGLMLAAMMVNSLFTYWNMHIKFPECLKAFEKWALQKELELKKLTDLLTSFTSYQDLLVAVFIIGIIPAIGEELLFRGILQSLFFRSTRNIHLTIIASAFIFSAVHLQIYGFMPRFLLGILLGYLFWWTKNLTFPIVAHFFNNTFSLIILFLHPKNTAEYALEGYQLLPLPIILFCSMIGIFLALYIQKKTCYLHK